MNFSATPRCAQFVPNHLHYPEAVKEGKEMIKGIELLTFLVGYNEEKYF